MEIQFKYGQKVWCIVDGKPLESKISRIDVANVVKYKVGENWFSEEAIHETKEELASWIFR